MSLISTEAVRRAVRRLDDEQAVAFVAALFDARGATTTVDAAGNRIHVDYGGRAETYRVCTGKRVEVGEDARLILTRPAATVDGVESHRHVVDADDLRAMLVYGVPRAEARELCRRFLGRPLVSDQPEVRPFASWARERSATSLVVGVVGFVLVVASLTGGVSLGGTNGTLDFGAPASTGSGSTPATASPTPPDGSMETAESAAIDDRIAASRLPPGVRVDGDIDEDTLADAHAKAVTGQSYRWTLTYREFVDGRAAAIKRETVSVESPTKYRTELSQFGRTRQSSLAISDVEAYADGSSRFEHRISDDGFDREQPRVQAVRGVRNGEGRYADRAEQYVQWYLSVSSSSLVDVVEEDGTRYYWLSLGDDPYVGVENSSGSALVDEHGIVHEVRRTYDVPRADGVSVVMTFRYTDFGTTTVTPPPWHETRTSGSNGNETAVNETTVTDAPTATNTTTTDATPTATNTTNVTTSATTTSPVPS